MTGVVCMKVDEQKEQKKKVRVGIYERVGIYGREGVCVRGVQRDCDGDSDSDSDSGGEIGRAHV